MTLQAVILAAGEGTRLRPLTQNRPKSLIPVANRPILEHLIDSVVKAGIRDIVVVVGYRKEQVMRHLSHLPVSVEVVEQKTQLGTAHALISAMDHIRDAALVLPGDNYLDPDSIRDITRQPDSMLITTHKHPSNFGVVTVEDNQVLSIEEKPAHATRMTVSCGVYHLSASLLAKITARTMTEAISGLIDDGHRITAIEAHDWQDAIYPWDILSMNSRLIQKIQPVRSGVSSTQAVFSGLVSIGAGTIVGPFVSVQGPVIIGENCKIGPHVHIGPGCSIGSRVIIEPFTTITSSILMDDVFLASHSALSQAVIGEGCTLGEHTVVIGGSGPLEIGNEIIRGSCGVIMGNGVFSSPHITCENSIIGNDVVIEARNTLRLRSKVIPDGTRVM